MTQAQTERDAIVRYVRQVVGVEAIKLLLVSGMPGGTRTERVKQAAYANAYVKAVEIIADAIERGDHIKETQDGT